MTFYYRDFLYHGKNSILNKSNIVVIFLNLLFNLRLKDTMDPSNEEKK
jgi:hypothetical protein